MQTYLIAIYVYKFECYEKNLLNWPRNGIYFLKIIFFEEKVNLYLVLDVENGFCFKRFC